MKDSRIIQLDYIRSLAIIFVIFIHSMGFINTIQVFEEAYFVRVILDSIIYSGVPLFVMLSGALLLGKQEHILQFFRKRFKRILTPFILWSLLIYTILYIQDGGRSIHQFLLTYIYKTLTTGVYGIYWYIYLIIGLYLITPILRKVCQDKISCLYTIIIIFVLYIIQYLFPDVSICKRFASSNLLYIGYYIAGYAISFLFKLHKRYKEVILSLFICILLYISSRIILDIYNIRVTYINDILTIIISILIYSVLMNIKIESKCFNRITSFISKTSYGIYLTHFVFISILVKFQFIRIIPVVIEPFVMVILVLICELILMYFITKTKLNKLLI